VRKDAINHVLELMDKHLGKSVFEDKIKFKAGLTDSLGFINRNLLSKAESVKVRNLLIIAVIEMRAYFRIKEASEKNEMFIINNLVSEMRLDYMIDKAAAQMVIECLAELLGYDSQGYAQSFNFGTVKKGHVLQFGNYSWIVLQSSSNRAFVICEDIVARRAYYNKYGEVAWKDCDLRQYLNSKFYNTFSLEEQSRIQPVWNDDSLDNVFILSIYEARALFKNDAVRIAKHSGVATWWWLRSFGENGTLVAGVNFDGKIQVYGSYARSGDGGGVRPALWLKLDDDKTIF
jgi:hypothetical protein